jgi:hypothetical protein
MLAFAVAASSTAVAQSGGRSASPSLEQDIFASFEKGDYDQALALIERHLEQWPNDAGMIYNGACATCLLKNADECAAMLLRAVKAGFTEFAHMRRDPDLDLIRRHPTYLAIVEAAELVASQSTRSALEQWRNTYGTEQYRYETDSEHRLVFATALDEYSHGQMRDMLQKQADQMIASLFGKPQGYDVLIAVPSPIDADKFFKGDDSIGGMYEHRLRRLVARDIGSSLRHEFFHALHYGHMERLGQAHPLWIQEGLASLYEDYDIAEDGSISFLPNDRQYIVMHRAKAGLLVKWDKLFALSADQFMEAPSELYPQVRSIFEFLAGRKKLETWYATYVETFDDDRTGRRAFEAAFNAPIKDVERSWRQWVINQPKVDLVIDADDAAMGVRTADNASNDGVLITGVLPRSAASRGGLRRQDVIVSVDGRSTTTSAELRRTIAARSVGDVVEVRVRRSGEYFTALLTLQPLSAGM